MQVHIAVTATGYVLSTIEPAPEQTSPYDQPPSDVPQALRPQVAKIRSAVLKSDADVVSTLGQVLEKARDAHDPDEPPLMGSAGSLLTADDGCLAVLFYACADRGIVCKHNYQSVPERLVLEHDGARVALAGSQSQVASEVYAFAGTAEAVEWTATFLRELREQAAKDAEDDDGDEEDD